MMSFKTVEDRSVSLNWQWLLAGEKKSS